MIYGTIIFLLSYMFFARHKHKTSVNEVAEIHKYLYSLIIVVSFVANKRVLALLITHSSKTRVLQYCNDTLKNALWGRLKNYAF